MRIGLVEFLLILAIASLTVGPQVALFVDRWMRRANRANARAARRRAEYAAQMAAERDALLKRFRTASTVFGVGILLALVYALVFRPIDTPPQEISGGSDPAAENAGFFSVSDPACGAGALLIAFANLCRRKNICYHDKVLFVAQDIDLIAGLMCYIQLSFLGCAGYVVIGNTITEPSTAYDRRGLLPAGPQSRIWYTPFFSTDIWYLRRQWAQIELLMKPVCRQTEQAEPEHKKDDAAPPLCETKTGQLTFF